MTKLKVSVEFDGITQELEVDSVRVTVTDHDVSKDTRAVFTFGLDDLAIETLDGADDAVYGERIPYEGHLNPPEYRCVGCGRNSGHSEEFEDKRCSGCGRIYCDECYSVCLEEDHGPGCHCHRDHSDDERP